MTSDSPPLKKKLSGSRRFGKVAKIALGGEGRGGDRPPRPLRGGAYANLVTISFRVFLISIKTSKSQQKFTGTLNEINQFIFPVARDRFLNRRGGGAEYIK